MSLRYAAALLTAYAALLVWLTWPLAAHVTTHLPEVRIASQFDPLLTAWASAHETRALTTAPTTLLDGGIFHPAPRALLYCEAGFGALPVFLPTFLATGDPTLALNLTLLLSLALTAAALHGVVARWVGSELGGALAAWGFLHTRWTLWQFAPTAPNYTVLHYFPFIMLLAATPPASLARALRLVPLLVLQSLSSIVYLAVAAFAPVGTLALGWLTRRATRAAGMRILLALALAVLVLLPLLLAIARVAESEPDLAWQSLWVAVWPKVSQPALHLPWGPFRDPLSPLALPPSAFVLIGVGAVSLALRGREARARLHPWAHGTLWAVLGLLLSLTPTVVWNERVIELPQVALAERLPILKAIRVPGRIGVAGMMGLALLVGAAFAECARRVTRALGQGRAARAVCLLLAGAVAVFMRVENARGVHEKKLVRDPLPSSYPLALAPTLPGPLAALLARQRGPLLELPLAGRGLEPVPHARAMYRAIFHRRPILNGYCGYWPRGFKGRAQLASLLPAPERLRSLRRETGLATILLHRGDLDPDADAAWLPAIAGQRADLRLIGHHGDDYVLAVTDDGG